MTYDEDKAFNAFLENVRSENYDWFTTLILPTVCWEVVADGYFTTWISVMEEVDGTGHFNWVRIAERKEDSMLLHVLIGGRNTRRRWEWMEGWRHDVTMNGNVYSRRMLETPRLRGLLRYLVDRLGCGLWVKDKWGRELHIHGANYSIL
jgi:hypothetical protein